MAEDPTLREAAPKFDSKTADPREALFANERLHYDKRLDQAVAYSDILTNVGNQVKAYQLTAITVLAGLVIAMLIGIFGVLWQINSSQQALAQRIMTLELIGNEQNANLDQVRVQNQSIESTIGSVNSEVRTLNNTLGKTPTVLRDTANLVEDNQKEFSSILTELRSNVERIGEAQDVLTGLGSNASSLAEVIGAISASVQPLDKELNNIAAQVGFLYNNFQQEEPKAGWLFKVNDDLSTIKSGILEIKK